ncbi:thiamine pyrophosphate-requiring protein [Patulibacter defluvii]|uniref:thiamine pyrophosphate-requiring protein n=1 Tax=Patulibacter defluvii TaxID=3095358 RepID=UPI002A750A4F|nr:thiamine pyrophosphate-requiring protein [Patulibacter sp. DM4]
MTTTTGEFLLQRLHDSGVRRIYGYPGDGINGFFGAFHQVAGVELIQTRHEEIAALAACAHAKLTGEVGVCAATSGPGAIHLLNGLYDAKLDRQPVLAIVGQQARISLGSDYQQEVDLPSLFKDVAGEFVQTCMTPAQAPHLVDRALRIARATRSPTCLVLPSDVQEERFDPPGRVHGATFSSPDHREPTAPIPGRGALEAAADLLNGGERVAILAGRGAKDAADELTAVAERLGAGVAKALNGRAVLPDDLPWVTGSIGLLGTRPSYELMEGCDTLLLVGTGFPYSEWLPEPGQARAVQIDVDGRRVGNRYPTEVDLVGDAAATLAALLPLLRRNDDRSWRDEIAGHVDAWWTALEEQAHQPAEPINPRLVFHELSPRLPDGCVLTADSGSSTDWWARHLKLRPGMEAILSGTLATMCPAVPYALAAKLALPDRPVVAVIGDGAMQMLGINALIDVARYRDRWRDPRLVICVLDNGDLNQVTWEQRVMAGDAKLEASQTLPPFDYAGYARLIGLEGILVDRPEDVAGAWDRALAAEGPVLLQVRTDPEVPPLPPHVRLEMAQGLGRALLRGDPAASRIVRQTLRGKLAELRHR